MPVGPGEASVRLHNLLLHIYMYTGGDIGKNVNPAQMARLNNERAKMIDPRVLQQMGKTLDWSFW